MSDYIPTEIIAQILSNLPSKSLIRFRSVCKSWLSLISSPEFVLWHAGTFNQRNPRMLVRHFDPLRGVKAYDVHFDDEDFFVDRSALIEWPFDRQDRSMTNLELIGSCKGVYCLYSDMADRVTLWNPSIRKTLVLHRSGINILPRRRYTYGYGLGYDRDSDDYKVVRVTFCNYSDALPEVKVYTVKNPIWRAVDFSLDISTNLHFRRLSHVFFNGSVHWLVCDWARGYPYFLILTFDVSTEVFGEIPLPGPLGEEFLKDLEPAVIGESLTVIYSKRERTIDSRSGKSAYMVWVMKEYKNPASWTMIYNVYYPNADMGRVLGFRGKEDLFIKSRFENLVIINPKKCNFVYLAVWCHGKLDSISVNRYQESLALLDAGHDIRSEDRVVSVPFRFSEGRREANYEL